MQKLILLSISLLMACSVVPGQDKEPGELLSAARYEEEVAGNLEEAIRTYQLIIDTYPGHPKIAAEALLHLGSCHEKLGNNEAIKAYELILDRYSDQKKQVSLARARLVELREDQAEDFMIQRMDFRVPEPFDLSPDGTRILGVRFNRGQNIVVSHLYKEKVDYITDYTWDDEYFWAYNPIWSPDGKEIAFNACFEDNKGRSTHSLRIADLQGADRILVESSTEWFVPNSWKPDGSSILIIKQDKESKQKLGLVDVSDGEYTELLSLKGSVTTPGQSRAVSVFSPDGNYILFTDNVSEEDSDLFIVSAEGGDARPFVSHPAVDKWPRWSPDGKHIIFLSNRHGSMALWGIAVDRGMPTGDPFLIQEGMVNNVFGNWTIHGLVSWNWIRIRDIFLMDTDAVSGKPSGKLNLLNYTPSGSNTHASYAPKSNRLSFIREDRDLGINYLVLTRSDGANTKEFEVPAGYRIEGVRWLPDESGIGTLCSNNAGEKFMIMFRMDTEAWEIMEVTADPGWSTFDWSGSGKAILYCKNGVPEEGAGIVEIDLETGEERYVYRPSSEGLSIFRGLRCSNDYTKAAFLEANSKLMVLDLKSGNCQLVNEGTWWMPAWPGDGQKLITIGSMDPEKEEFQVHIFPLSGGPPDIYDISQQLPEESRILGYQISPIEGTLMINLDHGQSKQMLYKNIIPDI